MAVIYTYKDIAQLRARQFALWERCFRERYFITVDVENSKDIPDILKQQGELLKQPANWYALYIAYEIIIAFLKEYRELNEQNKTVMLHDIDRYALKPYHYGIWLSYLTFNDPSQEKYIRIFARHYSLEMILEVLIDKPIVETEKPKQDIRYRAAVLYIYLLNDTGEKQIMPFNPAAAQQVCDEFDLPKVSQLQKVYKELQKINFKPKEKSADKKQLLADSDKRKSARYFYYAYIYTLTYLKDYPLAYADAQFEIMKLVTQYPEFRLL